MRNQPNYALLSVSDKTGIVDFARGLHELGIKLLSTGGTAKAIKDEGIPVTEVAEFTGSPEIFDGRVKTLHPKVHGGILNIRDNDEHQKTAKEMNIENIDIVAVNLYPFEKVASNPSSSLEDIIENIDIGGPAMVRSAAKNHAYVTIVVHPHDYDKVLQEIKEQGSTCIDTRRVLAAKAYSHTALYDTVISNYLGRKFQLRFREEFTVGGRLIQTMRYGENPHQDSAFYKEPLMRETGVCYAEQKHGKELSYNNIVDLNSAEELLKEFKRPACVIIKHNNPCGVAEGETLLEAYAKKLAIADQVYSNTHEGRKMSYNTKVTTAVMLNNVNRVLTEAFDNSTGTQRADMGDYKRFCLSITNVVFPSLIAEDVVIVKPMTSYSGVITYRNCVA